MKRSLIKCIASFFTFFCILFIPFPFNLVKFQVYVTDFLFGKLIRFVSSSIFEKELHTTKVYSDSFSMYILVLLLFILSVILGLILFRSKKWQSFNGLVVHFIYSLSIYYLALQLLKYGADKIFKNQFYIPEPNTLYTPIGQLEKDLVYWSAMGTSYFYSFFLGSLEVLAAIFILLRRTRLAGLLMSFGILINVIAVNFGFDISVKLYSLFLLYITFYLLLPYQSRLYTLLFSKNNRILTTKEIVFRKQTFLSPFLKWFVTSIILLEVFYPFLKSGNFNGDNSDKTYLHGAYEVTQMISATDTLIADKLLVKKIFIHKDSYMIFQYSNGEMKDYKLGYDKQKSLFILTDYNLQQTVLHFRYQPVDSALSFNYFKDGKETTIFAKALDWKKLPLLKKSFHWTVD